MIEEQAQIIFYVIVINIFDHFPDHPLINTILIKVPKKVRISEPKMDGRK